MPSGSTLDVDEGVHDRLSCIPARLDKRFWRVHRSAAVNLDTVREIHSLRAGDARLTLSGGRQVTLSRTHRYALGEVIPRCRLTSETATEHE